MMNFAAKFIINSNQILNLPSGLNEKYTVVADPGKLHENERY